MSRLIIVCAVLALGLTAVPSVEAGPIRNGAKAVGRGVVKVLKRAVHPFRRGC